MRFPHSLGLLYSAITTYLGFEANDAEWKVMGLAPYGKPKFADRFHKMVEVYDDGSFSMNMEYFSYHYSDHIMFNKKFIELMGHPPRLPKTDILEYHKDIASSLQIFVEDIITKLLNTLFRKFPSENVCLAGGVFLNSVANGRIIPHGPFKRWYIPSAPGDDGGAVGAALAVNHQIFNKPTQPEVHTSFIGPEFSKEEICAYLKSRELAYKKYREEELPSYIAYVLSKNKIVGLFQEKMEFGPRALGNRSILANPCTKEMKDRINEKIKYREFFRPFAPVVINEEANKYFDMDYPSPFMSYVFPVREQYRNKLPAITHVDGSARVQTVTMEQNSFLHKLLREFSRLSGYPVLLNTSFNRMGEPIVCTPHDAIECFINTGMDVLVMNPYVVTKRMDDKNA